jgi:hypothetical protein
LGEERRRFRQPPFRARRDGTLAGRYGKIELEVRLRGARGQRGERVARGRLVGRLAAEMNQAGAVGMLQRMEQCRLPAGKQGCDEKKPRETRDHFTSLGPRR